MSEVKEPEMVRNDRWRCAKCGGLFLDKDTAVKCCQPAVCACGQLKRPFYSSCDACSSKQRAVEDTLREKARFDKAQKTTPENYNGDMIFMEDDRYFSSYGGMLDHCEGHDVPPPDFTWSCEEMRLGRIDAKDDILENVLDEHHEDAFDQLIDVEGLQKFLDEWVNKQTMRSFSPCYNLAIVTNPEDRVLPAQVIILKVEGDRVHVQVPSWRPGATFEKELHDFSRDVQSLLGPGVVLSAQVTLGAETSEDVRFYRCEIDTSEGMLK